MAASDTNYGWPFDSSSDDGCKGEGGPLVLAADFMVAKFLSNELHGVPFDSSSNNDKEDDDNERWVEFDGTLEDLRRNKANAKGSCVGCRCSECATPVRHDLVL